LYGGGGGTPSVLLIVIADATTRPISTRKKASISPGRTGIFISSLSMVSKVFNISRPDTTPKRASMSYCKALSSALVVFLLIVAFSGYVSAGYFNSLPTDASSTPGHRTLGTPVSGFWNRARGTGALPTVIPLGAASSMAGAVPNTFSWNGYFGAPNYMTPVKDQGACGSCWAFAGVGDMEAQYQINKGNPSTGIDLSEQNVLQCSGGSCSGWYLDSTLNFLRDSGTPDEACNPYTATDHPCGTGRCSDYLSRTYYITGWTWISTDTATIKNYLYTHGPVMVWMPVFSDFPWYDANFWQYYFYSHSPSGSYEGHFVVIVGWDDQGAGTSDDYWIVRNSWGTSGGDVNSGYGGYFYMTQDPTTGFFGIYQEAAVISGVTSPSQMFVSYSIVGGGTPSAPVFHYVLNGVTKSLKLSKTSKPVSVDAGTTWSVTPNPLGGSSSSQRWYSNQPLTGTASSTTLVFTFYRQTLQTLSYSVSGGGSGYSPPTFQANQFGSPLPVTLTTTATRYWFDYGSTWTAGPNPLSGSTSSERWFTTQTITGTIGSSSTRAFKYQHQYYLMMQVSPVGAGSVSPSSGWHNAGQSVTIRATAKTGHRFQSWTGTGAGSYMGTSSSHTITMNSPITETANFS
jgi:C1A family cysteine protease